MSGGRGALQSDIPLVLASASAIRATLLRNAGLEFSICPAAIDERAVRQALAAAEPQPSDVAEVLARAKAEAISAQEPGAVVIGADQVLAFEGEILSKPSDMAEARATLLRLQGRTHSLHSGVCLARAGDTVWSHTSTAVLTMRPLTPQFVGRYLAAAGEAALTSVGAYQLEAVGVHLFSKVEGDYFAILGLPLLPLLDALRRLGVVAM